MESFPKQNTFQNKRLIVDRVIERETEFITTNPYISEIQGLLNTQRPIDVT